MGVQDSIPTMGVQDSIQDSIQDSTGFQLGVQDSQGFPQDSSPQEVAC